jgi:two-component system sensor histidine kinase/response regulator
LKTFLVAVGAGTLCQILKDAAFPYISVVQSQVVSVALAGVAAATAHFFVARNRALLLSEREARFGLLFYHNPLPMWLFDPATLGFLEVNDAALAHYGYSREEFLRLSILDIRPPEDIERLKVDVRRPRAGYRDAGIWRHKLKDGRIIWVQIINHLTEWQGRQASLVVAQDVTESKRSEEALRTTEELFRTAFEGAPFGMCLTGLNGRFLQANAALCRMLGYSIEELRGGKWESITHPDDLDRSRSAAARMIANPDESVELEKRYIPKEGEPIWVRLKLSTVLSSDGKPSHWIGHIEDITESKHAKAELVHAKEAAEAASRSKSQFLANMSHEIRTPMNGIIGMTELALASTLTAEQRDYLNTVRTSGEALLEIINDILDFSKIEAGKFTLNPSEFDLGQSLQEVMRMMAVPAHEKGLELLYENRAEFPARLVGDAGRLRQVIVNLLGNAIKFTSTGEVSLRVLDAQRRENGLELHLAVADTGIGVPPEWRKRIFKAFVQADGSNTRSHGGTGLGLAICARLVGYMGGRIWIESELGHGSEFHFTVQFRVPEAKVVAALSTDTVPLAGLHILVTDGNATLRRTVNDTLVRWGMKPVLAGSVAEAITALREIVKNGARFDVLLLDAHMPGLDEAFAAATLEAKAAICGPRIAMLNSLDAGSLAPELRASGHYLVKPVTPHSLHDTLQRVLGQRTAQAPASATLSASAPLRQLHILLAEDNVVNQKVAARLVEKLGHTVEIAGNGAQALAACEHETFDVILMDVQMPIMNGYDATRAIREYEQHTRRHTPIVALTAHAMKDDRGICLQAGMDDYLAKPIHPRELASALERWGEPSS